MRGYCRWCGFCIDNGYNDYYCTCKDKFITTATAKSYSCKEFRNCEIDIITGKDRRDLSAIKPKKNDGEQTRLF